MEKFSRSLEEQIRRAIKNGEFENLPGKGKPLKLDQNPHEDPTWSMAHQMLRSSGYTLPWIETRRTIEAELDAALASLERSWEWVKSAGDQTPEFVEKEWQRALVVFKAEVADLNKRISDYNLEAPLDQFKRRKINLEREISKITGVVD